MLRVEFWHNLLWYSEFQPAPDTFPTYVLCRPPRRARCSLFHGEPNVTWGSECGLVLLFHTSGSCNVLWKVCTSPHKQSRDSATDDQIGRRSRIDSDYGSEKRPSTDRRTRESERLEMREENDHPRWGASGFPEYTVLYFVRLEVSVHSDHQFLKVQCTREIDTLLSSDDHSSLASWDCHFLSFFSPWTVDSSSSPATVIDNVTSTPQDAPTVALSYLKIMNQRCATNISTPRALRYSMLWENWCVNNWTRFLLSMFLMVSYQVPLFLFPCSMISDEEPITVLRRKE